MKMSRPQQQNALTLAEVLILIVILFILAALLLPGLSRCGSSRTQIHCVSNLKQAGLGWLLWINDHESRDLPFRVPVANGGTFGAARSPEE